MHNSYYLLRQLCPLLNEELAGSKVVSCFSQHKDELMIEFGKDGRSFFIRAHLLPGFSCLSFPKTFHRARRNTIELFQETNLQDFTGSSCFENERAMAIQLQGQLSIIFKMHGNRANVLLTEGDRVTKIFKNELAEDLNIKPGDLHRQIDWSEQFFMSHRDDIRKHYFTWGKEVWRHLDNKGFGNLSIGEQWQVITQTRNQLEHPTYAIVMRGGEPKLSLLPHEGEAVSDNALDAITEFFQRTISLTSVDRERSAVIKSIQNKISSARKYIEKNSAQLARVENDQHFKSWADLIMANLHLLKGGAPEVTLTDFTNSAQPAVTIKMDPKLSPQKNAEAYYRKAKNQGIEIEKLREGLTRKNEEMAALQATLKEAENANSLTQLRKLASEHTTQTQAQRERLPFHEVSFNGFQIWIGKSAADNDELTLKHSHKEDLWLHAKDVAGSHVLVKHQSGKIFPKDVVERAAALAAWHSKRKTEGLVPVAYTAKKFVRKRKGDPPGSVVVEREKVILVEPKPT
ncbi:MAG: NFACT RNA binding domain-containing protein [Cyclobacteriaceae bacterium]